jgi:putative acetyltransferase
MLSIGAVDAKTEAVRSLAQAHLEFCRLVTPPEHVHALEPFGLTAPTVSVFAARNEDMILGIAALRMLSADRVEIKCMHTMLQARGQGVGRAILEHLLQVARDRHCRWVGLETGTMAAFAPARALYASSGFKPCEPFGNYRADASSVCMSLWLVPESES